MYKRQLLFRVTHAFDTTTIHKIAASTSTGTISVDSNTPLTLTTSPAPAPTATVAYATRIIELTTGIDQEESPDSLEPRQFPVPTGSFFELPATIPGDARFRYYDDPLDRRFHIDWHDLSRLQYAPHSDLETFENFPHSAPGPTTYSSRRSSPSP